MHQSHTPALISMWRDVSVELKVEGNQPAFKTRRACVSANSSFVCCLFHVTLSSYWYQMHPRIDWNSDPRTSDISSDSELRMNACSVNVAKHTHSATFKISVLFHWGSVLILQTTPSTATGLQDERWTVMKRHGTGYLNNSVLPPVLVICMARQRRCTSHKRLAQLSLFSPVSSVSALYPQWCVGGWSVALQSWKLARGKNTHHPLYCRSLTANVNMFMDAEHKLMLEIRACSLAGGFIFWIWMNPLSVKPLTICGLERCRAVKQKLAVTVAGSSWREQL